MKTVSVNINLLWLLVFIVLTVGEPDLIDGMIHYLMK